jgi:hypothetical protein
VLLRGCREITLIRLGPQRNGGPADAGHGDGAAAGGAADVDEEKKED